MRDKDIHNKRSIQLSKGSDETDSSVTMQIREEQLNVLKEKIQTGEVKVHKEVITEEKNITVPITREELVIETTVLDTKVVSKAQTPTETLRIPISEERVDVTKHRVILEDVSIYTNKFEEIESITETVKKEIAYINTTGDLDVIDEEGNS